ncbi:hypothetical protein MMC25_005545 [Agyrium rufum]|nr:hypothetical protein [Agyrium rufum]
MLEEDGALEKLYKDSGSRHLDLSLYALTPVLCMHAHLYGHDIDHDVDNFCPFKSTIEAFIVGWELEVETLRGAAVEYFEIYCTKTPVELWKLDVLLEEARNLYQSSPIVDYDMKEAICTQIVKNWNECREQAVFRKCLSNGGPFVLDLFEEMGSSLEKERKRKRDVLEVED